VPSLVKLSDVQSVASGSFTLSDFIDADIPAPGAFSLERRYPPVFQDLVRPLNKRESLPLYVKEPLL